MALRIEQSKINPKWGRVIVSDAEILVDQEEELGEACAQLLGAQLKRDRKDRIEIKVANQRDLDKIVERINRGM
jgi:hypothetical protein